jgi:hypothetical protein
MTLIDDARKVWHRLWSVRLALLSAGLSAAEFAMPYIAPVQPSGRFAALAALISVAAAVARIVAQPRIK